MTWQASGRRLARAIPPEWKGGAPSLGGLRADAP